MGRLLNTLKNNEPGIYWLAVDLAGRGYGSAYIRDAIQDEIELANEYRATNGKRTLNLDAWPTA